MAEVFTANHTGAAGFSRKVCIKQILPNNAMDPSFLKMFMREARFAGAEGDFAKAAEILRPIAGSAGESLDRLRYGALLLHTGNRPGYENLCTDMLNVAEASDSAVYREQTVKLCSAAPWPSASEVPATVLEMARRLAAEDPDNPWSCLAVGMAEYRSGHFETALPFLSSAMVESAAPSCRTAAQLYRSMANSELGNRDEAERDLKGAEVHHVPLQRDISQGWADPIIEELALAEARELLAELPK